MEVAAVEAPPGNLLVPGEYLALLYIILKRQVALLVLFFSDCNGFENLGDLIETLLTGDPGKTGVHLGPLVVLPTS